MLRGNNIDPSADLREVLGLPADCVLDTEGERWLATLASIHSSMNRLSLYITPDPCPLEVGLASPFLLYRGGEKGTERLRDLPRGAQQRLAETQTQTTRPQVCVFNHSDHFTDSQCGGKNSCHVHGCRHVTCAGTEADTGHPGLSVLLLVWPGPLCLCPCGAWRPEPPPPGRAAPHSPQEATQLPSGLIRRREAPQSGRGATEQGGGGAQTHLFGIRQELSTVGQKAVI